MYDGRTPLKKGTVVGHEIIGVIDEVGEAVVSIKKGRPGGSPFNIACVDIALTATGEIAFSET
jgi:glutathione-independent formaldehyde dehydrogenase